MTTTEKRLKWPKYSEETAQWLNDIHNNQWPKYKLEVKECSIQPLNPDLFWGGSVDYPKAGSYILDKQSINIGGWVFSKNSPVDKVTVSLIHSGELQEVIPIVSTAINTKRPDVKQVLGNLAGAENTGFDFNLSISEILQSISLIKEKITPINTLKVLKINGIEGLVADTSQSLWNFCFDKFYVPILPTASNNLYLGGWLLPQKSPAQKIDVMINNQVIQSIPVNLIRSDVKKIYPQVSWANNCGFSEIINIPETDHPSEIFLQTVLQNGIVLPLARIHYSFTESIKEDTELELILDVHLANGEKFSLAKIKCNFSLVKNDLSNQILTRKQKVLYHIDKNSYGIEIGPSHNPIAPKKEGYKVHIIDHLNREELMTKYIGHNLQLENIEEVDYVWQGEDYVTLTGKPKFYDWIIASHVIEHTPDFIGFLLNCDSILKDDGVISLVVPDKRYCFDHFRPITGLSKIIDAYYMKRTIHTPGSVAEYFLNTVTNAGKIAWEPNSTSKKYAFITSLQDTHQMITRSINDQEYIDVHAWCFTPHSFRLMIDDLYNLGLIPFQEVSFFPTTDACEFYITLGQQGQGPGISRLEMLQNICLETTNI